MRAKEELRRILQRIDGKGYKAYKDIEGLFDFREYQLFIDRAQREPITPFIDKIRQLSEDMGVSTILVIGGSDFYNLIIEPNTVIYS